MCFLRNYRNRRYNVLATSDFQTENGNHKEGESMNKHLIALNNSP